ncbi:hypothetical protein ACFY9N_15415 [Microbacterium sp. NPDC008134]|uniref:hypothetical protein n=1 Tax=Microbacterium sp. NPDC008134 TaxID=3364183 RepID=UPI0036F13461
MQRLVWVMLLVLGLAAVTTAVVLRLWTLRHPLIDAEPVPTLLVIVFFLGLAIVVVATIGNVVLTALDRRS